MEDEMEKTCQTCGVDDNLAHCQSENKNTESAYKCEVPIILAKSCNFCEFKTTSHVIT
jgi:hypothetical protein